MKLTQVAQLPANVRGATYEDEQVAKTLRESGEPFKIDPEEGQSHDDYAAEAEDFANLLDRLIKRADKTKTVRVREYDGAIYIQCVDVRKRTAKPGQKLGRPAATPKPAATANAGNQAKQQNRKAS